MRGAWCCAMAAVVLASTSAAPAPWLAVAPREEPQRAVAAAEYTPREIRANFDTLDYTRLDVARGGSAYLDGLRRSLERLLRPPHCDLASPTAAASTYNRTDTTAEMNKSGEVAISECQSRIRATESVRGVAELALYTSKLLASEALEPRRERQLVAALAKLLHSLAHTVGYLHEPPPPPTPETKSGRAVYNEPTLPPNFMNATSEQVAQMIRCLDPRNTDLRPSNLRCPPLPLPGVATDTDRPATDDASVSSTALESRLKSNESSARSRRHARVYHLDSDGLLAAQSQHRHVGYRESIANIEGAYSSVVEGKRTEKTNTRPEDPHQDLSDYLKFKQGRTITDDQVGAAQTRLSLERVFAEPSGEMARRYGSNYRGNDVFISGALRILADA